jgi:hypothetical protein
LLGLVGSLLHVLAGQPISPARTPADPVVVNTIVNLLEQSHELDAQVMRGSQLLTLSRQTELVSRFRADLGQQWANELLALSRNLEGDGPSSARNTAMRVLIRLDPNRALELLDRADLGEAAGTAFTPAAAEVPQAVFSAIVGRDGTGALPLLQQAADRLGARGHYPYAALGYAAIEASNPFWRSDKQRAIEILRSVFDPALDRYMKANRQYSDDFEFGTMLQVLAGGLPFDVVQPALHEFVKSLLAMDLSKYELGVEVYTRDGNKIVVSNPADATLTYFGQLVNRDSELAQQLSAERPALRAGLEATREGNVRSMTFGRSFQAASIRRPATQQFQTRNDAMAFAHINADAAIAKAEQLPADQRGSTLLDVARGIAGEHPDRAAELIASVQRDAGSPDLRMQLNVTSAQASVAASQGNRDALRELLRRGFELAAQVTGTVQNHAAGNFTPGLPRMVQVGIQNERELTVAFLDAVPPSGEKAELLLSAADALASSARLPMGSRSGPARPSQVQ